jgi:putative membrane protein
VRRTDRAVNQEIQGMVGFLIRVAIVALGLWLAAKIFSGLSFDTPTTLVAAALLLGIVNAVIRPVIVLLTLPVTLLTLGLFLLVINAGMLLLVAWMLDGFTIASFWTAVGASIIVSLTSWVASGVIGNNGRFEVLVDRR